MKKIVFIVFVCISNISFSQIISFDKIEHDFGIISEANGVTQTVFFVSNLGDKPLVINYVKPDCGCTTVNYTKDSIMPGGRGSINVTFNPKGYNSIFSKTVRVMSNSIEGQELNLTIRGTVKNVALDIEQKYHYMMENVLRIETPSLDFGVIDIHTIKKDTVLVYNPQDTAIQIIFPNTPQYMSVEMKPSSKIEPNTEGMMIISYDPLKRNEWGTVFDKLYFGYEGKKNTYKSRISISAVIQEDFSKITKEELKIAPRIEFKNIEYNFDTIQQGKIVTTSYSFKNVGKSPLLVRKIKTSCGCTAGQLDKTEFKKGEEGEIKVTFDSTHKQHNVNQRITVITNDPTKPIHELIIKGHVKVPIVPGQ